MMLQTDYALLIDFEAPISIQSIIVILSKIYLSMIQNIAMCIYLATLSLPESSSSSSSSFHQPFSSAPQLVFFILIFQLSEIVHSAVQIDHPLRFPGYSIFFPIITDIVSVIFQQE